MHKLLCSDPYRFEMAEQQQVQRIGFKSTQLFKEHSLGIGAFGAVCKAKCDDLVCAAKVIHPSLFVPMVQRQRLLMRRFEQECEVLSSIRHPNIILYFGVCQDGDTGLPVLLMELMDDSLTHFLDNSPQPIPYHITVNLCRDIALALSFLHSNNIVHRNLSSNNILLRGNILAKVTDFGMARFRDAINLHMTCTMIDSTDVYMPPEAVDEKAVYTDKMDCFSFGVVALHILTRQFPNPGARVEMIDDPQYPRAIKMSVPEIERRQNHIRKVDPNEPLLEIVLDCLKDAESERPSAEQLCKRMAALKKRVQYRERRQDDTDKKDILIAAKDQELREYRQENERQSLKIERLYRDYQRLEKDKTLTFQEKIEKDRQLSHVNHQLEERERLIADLETRVAELEERLSQRDLQPQTRRDRRSRAGSEAVIKLKWRKGEKAPCGTYRWCDAVIGGDTVYCMQQKTRGRATIHSYHTKTSKWSSLPHCPVYRGFALAVVGGALTMIGGFGDNGEDTNKLFSLTGARGDGEEGWNEEIPAMPTKRYGVSALCSETALMAVGGWKKNGTKLTTVEVFNTTSRQWHTATELPESLLYSSMTVCGDRVFLLGGYGEGGKWTQSVYSCSLTALLPSLRGRLARALSRSGSSDTWTRVADLPGPCSTAVSLQRQLLAVGGLDSNNIPTSDIRRYDPSTNSWEVISHMTTPRSRCLAAVLPDNKLMVVGGWISDNEKTDSIEIGE